MDNSRTYRLESGSVFLIGFCTMTLKQNNKKYSEVFTDEIDIKNFTEKLVDKNLLSKSEKWILDYHILCLDKKNIENMCFAAKQPLIFSNKF